MNTSPEPVIRIENVSVRYGRRVVLDNINMTVMPSEIRVILGPSGCGKTTLLKTMVGLLSPVSGSVTMFGQTIGELDSGQTMSLLRRVGILFQNGALLGSLTVAENVALPLEMHTRLSPQLIREIVAMKLSQVGLSESADLLPQELSGGMRKRAALARALALDPPILFCDEPSAGLDPVTACGLDELLLSLRRQLSITVVVVTHELASIRKIADNVVFLHAGRVLYQGDLDKAEHTPDGPIADFFSRTYRGQQTAGANASSLFVMENRS
jgi:phospholipid/cholesterol/gamma-HCH transport system ATP-binding protein